MPSPPPERLPVMSRRDVGEGEECQAEKGLDSSPARATLDREQLRKLLTEVRRNAINLSKSIERLEALINS